MNIIEIKTNITAELNKKKNTLTFFFNAREVVKFHLPDLEQFNDSIIINNTPYDFNLYMPDSKTYILEIYNVIVENGVNIDTDFDGDSIHANLIILK